MVPLLAFAISASLGPSQVLQTFTEAVHHYGFQSLKERTALVSQGRRQLFYDMTPAPWVPSWHAFAAYSSKLGLGKLNREGQFVPLSSKAPYLEPSNFPVNCWAVSPNGQFLATYQENLAGSSVHLDIWSVPEGRLLRRVTRKAIAKSLRAPLLAESDQDGIAWSPSSRFIAFAHGFGGGIDNGGMAETRTAVLDQVTGRIRPCSKGAPVAWINEKRLVMVSNRLGTAGSSIYLSGSPKSPVRHGLVTADFDGTVLILYREMPGERLQRERWSPDLSRRLSTYLYPPNTPFSRSEPRFVAGK